MPSLMPGTAAQLAARHCEMRALVGVVADALAAGHRSLPPSAFDALRATFASPVEIDVDWDGSRALSTPLVTIRVVEPRRSEIMAKLTARQCEVAILIAQGQTNHEIGSQLGIALATVKDHVHHILSRSGFRNRSALAAALRS
jgi:DNA-binding NarL/FixJ family response regulator